MSVIRITLHSVTDLMQVLRHRAVRRNPPRAAKKSRAPLPFRRYIGKVHIDWLALGDDADGLRMYRALLNNIGELRPLLAPNQGLAAAEQLTVIWERVWTLWREDLSFKHTSEYFILMAAYYILAELSPAEASTYKQFIRVHELRG